MNQYSRAAAYIQGFMLFLAFAAVPAVISAAAFRTVALTGTSNTSGWVTNSLNSIEATRAAVAPSSTVKALEPSDAFRQILKEISTTPTAVTSVIEDAPSTGISPMNVTETRNIEIEIEDDSDTYVPVIEQVRVNTPVQVQVQAEIRTETRTETRAPAQVQTETKTEAQVQVQKAVPVKAAVPVSGSASASVADDSGKNSGKDSDDDITDDSVDDALDDVSDDKDVRDDASGTPPSESVRRLEDVASATRDIQKTVLDGKQKLSETIDKHISDLIEKNSALPASATSTEALNAIRERLKTELNANLSASSADPEKLAELSVKIGNGLREAERAVTGNAEVGSVSEKTLRDIDEEVGDLLEKIEDKSRDLREKGGDLLFKDSNGDGISDYESVHVYNIDPEKPSPVSVYEGRTISAEEKVLLGFDPAKEELVKVEKEEPRASLAPITAAHSVKEVALSEEKKVSFKGQALPNSFVTLYIYSTPVVVTVKADENGDWNYTLDREIEDGSHTVYVATVSNSGKILARSSAVPFTKTAEAATIDESFLTEASSSDPGFLGSFIVYAAAAAFVIIVLAAIALAGRTGKTEEGN